MNRGVRRGTLSSEPTSTTVLWHVERLSLGGENSELLVSVHPGGHASETAKTCAVYEEEPKMQHLSQGAYQCEWIREA